MQLFPKMPMPSSTKEATLITCHPGQRIATKLSWQWSERTTVSVCNKFMCWSHSMALSNFFIFSCVQCFRNPPNWQWTTGSLTCLRSYACVYTRGWGTPTSQHNILTRKTNKFILVLRMGFEPLVRESIGVWGRRSTNWATTSPSLDDVICPDFFLTPSSLRKILDGPEIPGGHGKRDPLWWKTSHAYLYIY